MTIGERIQQLRQAQGLSQEALAEQLHISRQAVSKWEKNLSYPTTENLLTLAAVFHVSADELVQLQHTSNQPSAPSNPPENESKHTSPKRSVGWIVGAAIIAILIAAGFLLVRSQHTAVRPAAEQTGEFALLWQNEKNWEFLTVDTQEDLFPFGTSLSATESEQVVNTDMADIKLHTVPCGALHLSYLHITQNNEESEVITKITTITPGYETPRGIAVGSDEGEVLKRYQDELVYLLKESGSDILCKHDYIYVYSPDDAFGTAILFYISNGHVNGISVQIGDEFGSDAFRINNTSIFPIKDGKPDFSQRTAPETEEIDPTRTVYIALHTLKEDRNLSNEEIYQQRHTIYQNLQYIDWQAYGRLGEAGKEELTIQELLTWLSDQNSLSKDELSGLLAGCCRTNLDGWLSESYAAALARALIADSDTYIHALSDTPFTDEERTDILSRTAYGCTASENLYAAALSAVEPILKVSPAYSEEERANIKTLLSEMEELK